MDSMVEIIGYIASILVFATFYVKKILTLRLIAVSSNIAFILYALGGNLHPIFILHSLLLPLNLYRIFELKRAAVIPSNSEVKEYTQETSKC